MFNQPQNSIIIFVLCVLLLIALLCTFIVTLVYKYQQKRHAFVKEIKDLKAAFENTILQSQVEMQEETFQHVAGEIHDNIGQKLTLAKLYLNTINYGDIVNAETKVNDSLSLISIAINDLSDISRSMSSELVIHNGLVKVIQLEVLRLQKSGVYQVDFCIEGEEVFLETQQELILFRIVQESLNNIIKHAGAACIKLSLLYEPGFLTLTITDDGKGFDANDIGKGAGLVNMRKRAALLQGVFEIINTQKGGQIKIKIPLHESNKT